MGILGVREPTCLGRCEADNKGLSGESINVSWSIIRILILASECHRISPAKIQTNMGT